MLKKIFLSIWLIIISLSVVHAATFNGSFGFGSDYNLVNGNTSLMTSSEVEVTNNLLFTGNSATGDFTSLFGTLDFDVARNESIPLTVGLLNITDFLHDFTAVTIGGPYIDLQLAIDLIDITSLVETTNTGLSVLGNVMIRDLSGTYDNTRAALSMEFSEDYGNGNYTSSMSGNISTAYVPEPGSLILMIIGFIGYISMKKTFCKKIDDDYMMIPA